MDAKTCDKCRAECSREEVDVGVGVMSGPWGCPACGWSDWAYYDCSDGPCPAQRKRPGWHVDQWGRMTLIAAVADRLERFGIPGQVAAEVFGPDQPGKE